MKTLVASIIAIFLLCSGECFSQVAMRSLKGKVIADGRPSIGAHVIVHGTRLGSKSDIKGKFELKIPIQDTVILVVSNVSEPEYYYIFQRTRKLKIKLGKNRKESDLIKGNLLRESRVNRKAEL